MSNKKIWFITGASRGMGADFAKAGPGGRPRGCGLGPGQRPGVPGLGTVERPAGRAVMVITSA